MTTILAGANAMNINSRLYEAKLALKAQYTRVEQLRKDLEHEEKKLDQMKDQLETLRAYKPTQTHPISTLPKEILSLILRESSKDVRQNVILMLVCRDWQRIIEDDPQMWRKIVIKLPWQVWNIKAWTETHRPLVQMWVARSGATLLDISLKLGSIGIVKEQVRLRLYDGTRRTVAELNPTFDTKELDLMLEWLDTISYGILLDDPMITEGCSGAYIVGLLADLIGHNGEIMRRWQSFKFYLPEVEMEVRNQIWAVFCHPTPYLHTLIINGGIEDFFSDWYAESPTENQISSRSVFPALPSLFKLDISTAIDWDVLSLQHSTIRTLKYPITNENAFIFRIGLFKNLKRLEISYSYELTTSSSTLEGDYIPQLPLLEVLSISDYGRHTKSLRLLLPKLVELTLRSLPGPRRGPSPSLPILSPQRVIFMYCGAFSSPEAQVQRWLKHCVNHFCQVEEFTFDQCETMAVSVAFNKLLTTSTSTPLDTNKLKYVSFRNSLGDKYRDLWTMEQLKNGRKN